MITRVALATALLLSTALSAQSLDPLRNITGTTANPGSTSPWVLSQTGGWTFFHGFNAHVTYVNEVGPEEPRNEVFSTNWFAAGAQRTFGDRAFLLARGRVSLEPYTMPADAGYPQVLQYVTAEGGGPLIDTMRPQDLFGEAAVQFGYRPTRSTLAHVYGALVGTPALGPAPFGLRSSAIDFAAAPFAYDIQETYHDSTSVVTAGFATRWIGIEGSVFADTVTTGDHTELADGDIDSRSLRLTLTPSPNVSIQVSRGQLGEDLAEREVSSASVSFGGPSLAVTALWTQREYAEEIRASETAYGFEVALRGGRHTLMGRAEWVDRPAGFPELPLGAGTEQTAHLAVGYLFDFIAGNRYRAGIGVNIDYHTQTHDIEHLYGHKPQSIYTFLRFRTAGI